MKILKFFESFGSSDTFKSVDVTDLVLMNLEQVKSLISNTFESEVVFDTPTKTVIKSKWKVLEKENEMTSRMFGDIIDDTFEIYFHIFPTDYTIVRGGDNLSEFVTKIQSIDNSITGRASDKSVILKGKNFYHISYSLPDDIDDMDEHSWADDWDYLRSMGCGSDLRLENKKISYYSDLLIGSQMDMEDSMAKKYPGLSKTQAIMKDIEERSKPTLTPVVVKSKISSGIFKGSPDWNEYKDMVVNFNYERMLFEMCDGLVKRGPGEYFYEVPKHFEKMKFNMHEYEPAEVYYYIRISEIKDTIEEKEHFTFQWVGRLFASPQHLQNYYKKYPKFGPGGDMHTFKGSDGKDQLSYQPPMFKDVNSIFGYGGDAIDGNYYCTDREALFVLIEQFNEFMQDNSQSHFETDYPKYKE